MAGYKLEISFNNCNSVVEKVEPSSYNKTVAARLMDDMLEYYKGKMKQTEVRVSVLYVICICNKYVLISQFDMLYEVAVVNP